MGNDASGQMAYATYTSNFYDPRTEFFDVVGRDVKVMKPKNPRFEGEEIFIIEFPVEDAGKLKQGTASSVDPLQKLRRQIEQRKKIKCRHLSILLWTNLQTETQLCADRSTYQLAFEYSSVSLARKISENRISKGMGREGSKVKSAQVGSFLQQISDALEVLRKDGVVHGFVAPSSVIILDASREFPLFKLLDINFAGVFPKLPHQRLRTDEKRIGIFLSS